MDADGIQEPDPVGQEEEPEPSPLVDLPDEVWGLILKKVPQKDALILRTVNKDFKEKVTNLYEDWKIELNQKSPFLEMILNLRVKEVKVYNMTEVPSFRPPGILFKYPNLIQKLRTGLGMSSETEHIMLQSKHLKFLYTRLYDHSEFFPTLDPQLSYNYPDLHTLKMNVQICRSAEENLQPGGLVQRIMLRSSMPKLTSFQVYYNEPCNKEMISKSASILLTFLRREGRNLKLFTYKNDAGMRTKEEFNPIDEATVLSTTMTNLETVQLTPFSEKDPFNDIWRNLMTVQRNLVYIDFSSGLLISSPLLNGIVSKNFQTLTSIKINALTYPDRIVGETEGEFDLSIFENCSSLITLKVCEQFISDDHEVSNLCSLPKQIQTLELLGFVVDSEDIVDFLSDHSRLCDLSIDTPHGVNVSVLETVLTHQGLLSMCITKIEVPTNRSGLVKLRKIYSKLGCRKVNKGKFDFEEEFLIKRKSVDEDWKVKYRCIEEEGCMSDEETEFEDLF